MHAFQLYCFYFEKGGFYCLRIDAPACVYASVSIDIYKDIYIYMSMSVSTLA